eukprot:scaffold1696_cov258-Pinguiococcus_pyrenoidosus.AAC.25
MASLRLLAIVSACLAAVSAGSSTSDPDSRPHAPPPDRYAPQFPPTAIHRGEIGPAADGGRAVLPGTDPGLPRASSPPTAGLPEPRRRCADAHTGQRAPAVPGARERLRHRDHVHHVRVSAPFPLPERLRGTAVRSYVASGEVGPRGGANAGPVASGL